jgi:6-pyruvoyltetrahydropterin/6-carboxytetrahydropterin synthase
MSHALFNYDGLCRNIHGHSYKLQITVAGQPANSPGSPKDGMVIDFSILKKLIQEQIISKLDHSLMINENAPTDKLDALGQMYERHQVVPFQPTSENLVVYIAEQVKPLLSEHIELSSVRLYETSSSFAEWYASDNPESLP